MKNKFSKNSANTAGCRDVARVLQTRYPIPAGKKRQRRDALNRNKEQRYIIFFLSLVEDRLFVFLKHDAKYERGGN